MDLNDLNVEELKSLKEAVLIEICNRREKAIFDERSAKIEREAKFRGGVVAGDVITFLFFREKTEAKVIRASDKSVTVELDGKTTYIKYFNIVGVVKVDAKVKTDEADNETEDKEAVA